MGWFSIDAILSRFVPGKASPRTVLEVLLKLHHMEHMARTARTGKRAQLSKPGGIRPPAYCGLERAEYQRSGINERN